MRLLAAASLTVLLAAPVSAKDPIMEALSDPSRLEAVVKERKPKPKHLKEAYAFRRRDSMKVLLRAGVKAAFAEAEQAAMLNLAVTNRDTELTRLLLQAGIRPIRNAPGWPSPLSEASTCYKGENVEIIAALLDAGADPDGDPSSNLRPIDRATYSCCPKQAALLLDRGVALKSLKPAPDTCRDIMRLFLDRGGSFDASRLADLIVEADTDTVRMVLESGPITSLGDRFDSAKGLRRALFGLSRPDFELAKLIVKYDPVQCVWRGQTLLQEGASRSDGEPFVRFLLEHGAKPDELCEDRTPPLALAACAGSSESAAALAQAGADQTNALRIAVRMATNGRCPASGVDTLLKLGARIPIRTVFEDYGEREEPPAAEALEPLLAAKPDLSGALLPALRWPQVARRLVTAGADPRSAPPLLRGIARHYDSPLFPKLLRAALEVGADPDARAEGGDTLLMRAATDGRADLAALLLKHRADPNAADKTGRTALMNAAHWGRPEVVSLLLKNGADPQRVEARGKTALDLALSANSLEAAQLLRGVTKTIASAAPTAPAPPAPDPAALEKLVERAVAARVPEKPAAPAAPASEVEKPSYSAPEDPDAFALVVGVEEYSDLPKASFAERDAAAVRRHFKALGVPERNLVLLTGPKAGRAALTKYLESWLPKNANERSKVYFYFSGHGAPEPSSGRAYLMPWDGDPSFLAETAYPLERLYQKLDGLKAKQVLVALDACFSGAGGRSVLPEGTRPLVTKVQKPAAGRLTVLSATQPDQITGVIKEKGHGIFTYHLLKGLSSPGEVTPASLYEYLKPRVQDEARRQNREQTPSLLAPAGGSFRIR